eukprot:CAMPEP_0178936764 /NCGR_PEP_ID=MMETSP0786-20121207/25360_1 /TAXON_ID=186022 /ORGANISM="Thalassionema frauenfeldii, Strain CCMP 1798" /LENGTH=661 /DNA_ID=CAMNT_0020615215 /DNA_START=89 /DNA_END=2075 /DNA_ORIENTATION=+
MNCAVIFLWCSLALPTLMVQCFSSGNSKSSIIRVSQEGKMLEQKRSLRGNSSSRIPSWRVRYEKIDGDAFDEKLQVLKCEMLDQGFSSIDIREIFAAIGHFSGEDIPVMAGMIDTLQLILRLEEKSAETVVFASKEVLLASAIHYAECMGDANSDVHDLGGTSFLLKNNISSSPQILKNCSLPEVDVSSKVDGNIILKKNNNPFHSRDEEVSRIVQGSTRIKQVEMVARVVLGTRSSWSKEEAVKLRSFLLSYTDDWRSLGIRVVACLFRLEGIILASTAEPGKRYFRSSEDVRNAREALRVYAPLAQQLGMQDLKAEIEDCAFRILYRRQYRAATALYYQSDHGVSMEGVSIFLRRDVTRLLLNDKKLVNELEDIRITSRVKEMFSSWKKLVRKRFKRVTASKKLPEGAPRETAALSTTNQGLSLTDLKDGVALRVVLRARKYTEFEADEVTRAREQLLCYYAQHLIRNKWPVLSPETVKDYIRYPKANGYQSLHYTSFISSGDQEWPFEIQVRSDEMHRIAEYGMAAHWDYKLGEQNNVALAEEGLTYKPTKLNSEDGGKAEVTMPRLSPPGNSHIDALVSTKQQIVQNKIFVFFVGNESVNNERQLMSLPLGAKVFDALNQLETFVGPEVTYRILKNGATTSLDSIVQNGDVLFVALE